MTLRRRLGPGAWLLAAALAIAVALVIVNGSPRESSGPPAAAHPAVAPITAHPAAASGPALAAASQAAGTIRRSEAAGPPAAQTQPIAAAHRAAPAAGLVVGIDPETGELGLPTGAELRQLREAAAPLAVTGEPPQVRHPDGSYSMAVDERLAQYSVARITPQGTVETGCLQGPRAVRQFLADSLARPSAGREER